MLVDRRIELGELFLQRFAKPGDALGRAIVAHATRALAFGGNHLDDLASTSDQIGEKSRHLVRQLPQFWFSRFGEMSDYSCIDRIGLGPFAERLGEGAYLRRVDHQHRQAGASQARRDHCFEAAGSLNRHRFW